MKQVLRQTIYFVHSPFAAQIPIGVAFIDFEEAKKYLRKFQILYENAFITKTYLYALSTDAPEPHVHKFNSYPTDPRLPAKDDLAEKLFKPNLEKCIIRVCDNLAVSKKHGYCQSHLRRYYNRGYVKNTKIGEEDGT